MRTFTLAAIVAAVTLVSGCETMKTMDTAKLSDAGSTAYKAMSLSDGDVAAMSDQSCAAMDQKSQIATASSKYAVRLAQVVRGMPTSVNAWAMANGCIRVYSGLMDLMNDDELRGVIGHEIGHVALGHSKARMQTAYAASAVRGLAASAGGVTAALSQSQAGDLGEKFINAQFSQSQESAADNYSFDLLTSSKLERKGLVTAFQKLAKLSGTTSTGSSIMNSHPPSAERAASMQKRLDSGK